MMNMRRGRRVTSSPLTQGTITSEFGRLCGLGARNIGMAVSSSMSNAPPFVSPIKARSTFAVNRDAMVMSAEVALRFVLMVGTSRPSSVRCFSEPSSKPIMLTWTLAPARIHGRSLSAKKTSPLSLMRFNVSRFAPPRIPCVASRPARLQSACSISSRAFSNQ